MKIKFLRQYPSRSGNGSITFVYAVEGEKEKLEAYKKSKGEHYREQTKDEAGVTKGTPLFFTTRFVGNAANLVETSKNEWVPNTSEADRFASLVHQYGGNVELAKEIMKMQKSAEQ